eukprot:scaffold36787_cov199-Amphora_coffeaeformis.AAC.1
MKPVGSLVALVALILLVAVRAETEQVTFRHQSAKYHENRINAICYAERYPDLFQGFCDGDASKCRVEELLEHYEQFGQTSELLWGCRYEPKPDALMNDAVCYAIRYPDLFQGFCGGNKANCNDFGLYEHYQNIGKKFQLIWGCRDRPIVPAKPLDFEGPQFEDPEIHILVFETSAEKAAEMKLAAQSLEAGIELTVFGIGTKFQGFGTKWGVVQPMLHNMHPDTIVAIVDGRDVLLNIHKEDKSKGRDVIQGFIQSYLALTSGRPGSIVMSTEGQCCVSALTYAKPGDYFDRDGNRLGRACASGEEGCLWNGDSHKLPWENFQQDLAKERTGRDLEDVYLNAGLVTGRAAHILNIIQTADMEVYEDDQAVFTDFMYKFPDLIILDYAQQLFGNARWTKGMRGGGCPFEHIPGTLSLEHQETKTLPLFLHSPGKFFACFDHVADDLGLVSRVYVQRRLRQMQETDNSSAPSSAPSVITPTPTFEPCSCDSPTAAPTESLAPSESRAPSGMPSSMPSMAPSGAPTVLCLSSAPSSMPSESSAPSASPSGSLAIAPSTMPSSMPSFYGPCECVCPTEPGDNYGRRQRRNLLTRIVTL